MIVEVLRPLRIRGVGEAVLGDVDRDAERAGEGEHLAQALRVDLPTEVGARRRARRRARVVRRSGTRAPGGSRTTGRAASPRRRARSRWRAGSSSRRGSRRGRPGRDASRRDRPVSPSRLASKRPVVIAVAKDAIEEIVGVRRAGHVVADADGWSDGRPPCCGRPPPAPRCRRRPRPACPMRAARRSRARVRSRGSRIACTTAAKLKMPGGKLPPTPGALTKPLTSTTTGSLSVAPEVDLVAELPARVGGELRELVDDGRVEPAAVQRCPAGRRRQADSPSRTRPAPRSGRAARAAGVKWFSVTKGSQAVGGAASLNTAR